jgi:hypothetical protein
MSEEPKFPLPSELPKEAMNVVGIERLFAEKGIKRMEEFKPGEPFLFILPDNVRKDNGPFLGEHAWDRPCVARVHNPVRFMDEGGTWTVMNDGGPVDYYTIINGVPKWVTRSNRETSYTVTLERSYHANNELFPLHKPAE